MVFSLEIETAIREHCELGGSWGFDTFGYQSVLVFCGIWRRSIPLCCILFYASASLMMLDGMNKSSMESTWFPVQCQIAQMMSTQSRPCRVREVWQPSTCARHVWTALSGNGRRGLSSKLPHHVPVLSSSNDCQLVFRLMSKPLLTSNSINVNWSLAP